MFVESVLAVTVNDFPETFYSAYHKLSSLGDVVMLAVVFFFLPYCLI